MRKIAEEIFLAGVDSVLPEKLIQSRMKLSGGELQIAEKTFPLSHFQHIYVLAAGKAAALMAKETENILGDNITDGHVVTKYGHGTELKYLTLTEAGHPIPDAEGIKGTQKMLYIAQQANENDLVICLISGGASALMADFPEGASLDDLKRTNELLVKCGADITEINTVRKHLSNVKGGQLAKTIYPATTISLILSDVIGDRLDVIASGPTVGDSSTFADALAVIEKYSLNNSLPVPILSYLHEGANESVSETPKPDNPVFQNVHNYIIGSNRIALESAAKTANKLDFETHIITDSLQGDVTQAADFILKKTENHLSVHCKPICLLFGGEPTVKVSGNGLGGRNQHLALYLSTRIDSAKDITVLCAGTDGTDGPTDAAGAVINNKIMANAAMKNINLQSFLQNSDSYHFFQQVGGHIIIGNTGTNVMDIIIVLIK
ncbi:MAG: glycerate kinase type-2 family protein [Petrimonas sp.]|jgi:hydroxypyruvate reductase/glycerate 2-kinase